MIHHSEVTNVSTPEERLRKRAQEAMQNPPETSAQRAAREKEKIREASQRLRNVGEAYLTKVRTFIDATRMRVFYDLNYSQLGTAQGFTLYVGQHQFVQARMQENGWHVTVRDKTTGTTAYNYASDDSFLEASDELLESLVGGAIDLLVSGQDVPAPDAYGRS